ncbi:MAG TPA: hypothetical protein VLT61_02630 [Anaeromyxobacteraceae bacterium]|nr:hypothetical protein [Anaeromyxobacteraceae bacterium]
MLRFHLPLLPLPVLAIIVAFSACSKTRSEEAATHVIPPAASYAALTAPAPRPAAAHDAVDATPTAEDVKQFERPVLK